MSYKIAVASKDRVTIDRNFGAAREFLIYEVSESGKYSFLEVREVSEEAKERSDCNAGCAGNGCGGLQGNHPGVASLADCRCVVCKKTGFHIQKLLEKKAITTFDVEGKIEDTLQKITLYFLRVDHHQSLRGIANEMIER
jgi:nitrogen fixation protein NifX